LSPALALAVEALQWLFLLYFAGLNAVYIGLNLVALRVIGRERTMRDIEALPDYGAGLEPAISVLVPGYNEEATIAASVRSMLQLDYPDFEVIVINDGSKDATLEVLKREFALKPFPEAYRVALQVEPVRNIYRSTLHPNLRVIDKDNGGKADALNAGINAARHALFCGVDADSVLQRDSLRRIVRPFMEDRRIIACGGTVRIANGCRISQGYLESVGMPSSWLARVQIVEYLRAFLFGRLGWSPMNAVLIISGAFGLFRRQAVIEAGGYRTSTIGEDMELIVRMHRLSREGGHDYRIVFVPDPVCWTEAPESLAVLKAQRVRWQRGLLESLWLNRSLLFARRSGAVGWLAFPVMTVFEAIGPVIEFAGYIFMTVAFVMGGISGTAFAAFMVLAVGLGLMLSASALLLEEMSFRLYPRLAHLRALVAAMVVENVGYRQLNSWWRLVGIWKWLRGGEGVWGEMRRKGVGT
jgi:cellulose synthase/poly-beta-1,6-N-acetylglucosamine synthase-like glycosyltransferase